MKVGYPDMGVKKSGLATLPYNLPFPFVRKNLNLGTNGLTNTFFKILII